jgi:hypothetical protein
MATFPTLSIAPGLDSTETTLDDLETDRATNGAPRSRSFYTLPKKKFDLVFSGCNATDKAAVEAFYSANKIISFSFTWVADGVTYTCYFSKPAPQYRPLPGMFWRIGITLVQA